jgi:hypothetical protein
MEDRASLIVAGMIAVALHLTPAVTRAEDVPVAGTRLVAKSAPHTSNGRFRFRAKSAAVGDLLDPAIAGAAITAIEASCSGSAPADVCSVVSTSGRIELDGANWKAAGTPPGRRGYRYRDRSGASGGVRDVIYRDDTIAIKSARAGWPWQPAGGADLTLLRLEIGDRTYCSEFGGIAKSNEPGFLLLRDAPAPTECRAVCGDGEIAGEEECDPPDGGACDATCRRNCPEDASSVLVDCVEAPIASVGLAANGATFAAAYRKPVATHSHIFFKRLDAAGDAYDATAVRLSEDIPDTTLVENDSPTLTALDEDFYAAWSGAAVWDPGFVGYFHGRPIPATGPPVEDVDILLQQSPFGQCRMYSSPPLHVTSNLAATGVHLTFREIAACFPDIILGEIIVGVPGDFSPYSPTDLSTGAAPLATGNADVAGVWWNLFRAAADSPDSPVEQTLKAGWISPAPSEAIVLTSLDSSSRSESPSLAATGDLFLAVWTTAIAPPPAVPSEVRGMRFTRADGALDPEGGFLIASSASGAALQPVVASDGTRFAVAWRETTPSGSAVRAIRVETDGTLADPVPIEVATSDAAAVIAVAASPSGTLVAFTRDEGFGLLSVRVAPLP